MGDYTLNRTKKGWLTAILELGAWLGTLLSSFIAEVLSRKYGVLVACSVFVLGVIIQTTAVSAGANSILAGRFITWVKPSAALLLRRDRSLTMTTVVWVLEVWP